MKISWNRYYMNVAKATAEKSTCDKLQVGAIIVKNGSVVSTGYNTAVRGLPHCKEAGHFMPNGKSRTVHAETNAIAQAARLGIAINGAELYVTVSPCWNCFKSISACGIKKIYFEQMHTDVQFISAAEGAGIELEQVKD